MHETDDAAGIVEGMAGAFGVTPDDARMAPVTLVGTQGEMIELLEQRRARWQMSYHVVGSDVIDSFAPIVAELAGT